MDKYVGKRLDGRYELKEIVGIGGMANIYKSTDIVENREVAIKILKDEFMENQEFLRNFRNESKAVASLSHPNIVKIFDVNFGDRIQYIVMEYIDGITLKEYIEQCRVLTWKDTVHFTVQILKALQHAHDKGIVHRDIKPQNIMLLSDGTIKVMDFGIAKFSRDSRRNTNSEKAIGSVHYISPEQARAENADEKSDIYSVGVMMYEMLTGRLPFDGDVPEKIAVMQMQSTATPPRQVNDTIPEGLEEIVIRAMQKEPAMRYQSAAEMLMDIDRFKKNPSIVFEYKYFSEEGSTKYFDAINEAKGEEEEEEKKKSITIPILAAIAGAFVLVTAIFVLVYLLIGRPKTASDIELPDMVGMTIAEVQQNAEYQDLTLNVSTESDYHDEYDKGIIYEQDVKAGTSVKSNSKVTVFVSKGIKTYPVPDLVGMNYVTAREQLEKEGFTNIKEQGEFSDDVAKNSVIRLSHDVGDNIKKSDEIIIYFSNGRNIPLVSMPNLLGRTEDEARNILTSLGLNMTVGDSIESEDWPEGTVARQSFTEGTQIEAGQYVTVNLSEGTSSQELNFNTAVPSTAKGEYVFTVTVDGAQETFISGGQKMNSRTYNVEDIGYSFSFTLESKNRTGTSIVEVYAQKSGSSKGAYATYRVNFSTGAITGPSYNPAVFIGDTISDFINGDD